jgi:hypothetical protein
MKYKIVPALIICAAAISGPAFADARDDVLAGVARCGSFSDHRVWLDCFYGAAQPLRAELGLPPAPASQTGLVPLGSGIMAVPSGAQQLQAAYVPQKPAEPPLRQDSGWAHFLLGSDTLENHAHVADYGFDSKGLFTITLADDEVWQQTSADTNRAHWDKPFARYRVSIKQAAVGSYDLLMDGENVYYKVRRIR